MNDSSSSHQWIFWISSFASHSLNWDLSPFSLLGFLAFSKWLILKVVVALLVCSSVRLFYPFATILAGLVLLKSRFFIQVHGFTPAWSYHEENAKRLGCALSLIFHFLFLCSWSETQCWVCSQNASSTNLRTSWQETVDTHAYKRYSVSTRYPACSSPAVWPEPRHYCSTSFVTNFTPAQTSLVASLRCLHLCLPIECSKSSIPTFGMKWRTWL